MQKQKNIAKNIEMAKVLRTAQTSVSPYYMYEQAHKKHPAKTRI